MRDRPLGCMFGAQALDGGGIEAIEIQIVALPGLVAGPALGRYGGLAGHPGCVEPAQRQVYGGRLGFRVMGLSGGVAEGEIAPDEAGHPDPFHDVAGAAEDNGGNAVPFEVSGDQTHGLMADRSRRHQQRNVGVQATAGVEGGWRVLVDGGPLTAIGGNADDLLADGAQPAGGRGFLQRYQG